MYQIFLVLFLVLFFGPIFRSDEGFFGPLKDKIEAIRDGRQQEYRGITGEGFAVFPGRFYLIRAMVSR
jgi:hypothetical protein